MALFLKNTIFFSFIFILSCIVIFSFADGTTDAFYLKFTTPKQTSLIIGSSRAAQGLIPSEIKIILPESDFYNYSFSVMQSPYGLSYLKSIKRKLKDDIVNSQFIVCVNPWAITTETKTPEDPQSFREVNTYLNKTFFVNRNPNYEYLIESFNSKNAEIIRNKLRNEQNRTFFVHDDGWLDVNIKLNNLTLEQRYLEKIRDYQYKLKINTGLSQIRLKYLRLTIEYLKERGNVYLLRVPISEKMLEIEQQLLPNFDDILFDISDEYNIPYLNEMPNRNEYNYTDGHHLTIESAKRFSKFISDQLNNQ